MQEFGPQLILVSAGFDGHILDPLASLEFEDEDYYSVGKLITEVANEYCSGRVISFLEGGYELGALARSTEQHLKCLLED